MVVAVAVRFAAAKPGGGVDRVAGPAGGAGVVAGRVARGVDERAAEPFDAVLLAFADFDEPFGDRSFLVRVPARLVDDDGAAGAVSRVGRGGRLGPR